MSQEERLVRTISARRGDGSLVEIEEHQLFTDVTTLRDRAPRWLPGATRFQLASGGGVVGVDETTFRVIGSGELLTIAG